MLNKLIIKIRFLELLFLLNNNGFKVFIFFILFKVNLILFCIFFMLMIIDGNIYILL